MGRRKPFSDEGPGIVRSMHVPGAVLGERDSCVVWTRTRDRTSLVLKAMDPEETTHRRLERRVEELEREVERLSKLCGPAG